MTDEVAQIENDLDQARAELHQTLEQVTQKVEAVSTHLIRPENALRVNPLLSICLAGAAGVVAGTARDRRGKLGAFVAGLILGFAIRRCSSREDSRHG